MHDTALCSPACMVIHIYTHGRGAEAMVLHCSELDLSALLVLSTKAMRGFALVIVALLIGELQCARTTPSPAPAPAPAPAPPSPEPQVEPPPPQAPEPTPPPRRRGSPHRRAPSPPRSAVPPKQDPPPPRQVVPPQEPVAVAAPPPAPRPRAINYTVAGCSTLLVFGDSTVDPGNNNRLRTTAKANFLPYGINFYGRRPTGRFSNGRLATDMLAERLGIARTIPGFHNPRLKLAQLRKGVSFASAGSGYDDSTADRLNVVSFPKQIKQLWRYKLLIRTLLGARKAERLVNKATFVVSAGTNDMLFNYLAASNRSGAIGMPQYENYLIARLANYTQAMRMLGGTRFVFAGLPPIGCLPMARTSLGTGADRCDENLNQLAASFNSKLLDFIRCQQQHQTRACYVDTYRIIREATESPGNFGLSEVWRGCCGSGVIEVGQTCGGRKACADPSKHLYWDALHPTEATNQLVANAMTTCIREIMYS